MRLAKWSLERDRAARPEAELSLRAGLHLRALHLARLAGGARRLRREARGALHRSKKRLRRPRWTSATRPSSRSSARRRARWLEANVPAQPLAFLRHARGLRGAPRLGGEAPGGRLGGGLLAGRVRRARRGPARVADLRGGVLPRGRAEARQPERHLPARADADGVRHARAEGALPAEDGERARRSGRRAGPSRTPAATWRRSRPARGATATSTCCAGRRPGPRAAPSRTGCSGCSAPIPPASATAGSASCWCRSTPRASRCARSRSSTARPASRRCSSTTCACPSRTGSARRARAGRWRWRRPASSAA